MTAQAIITIAFIMLFAAGAILLFHELTRPLDLAWRDPAFVRGEGL